jgi:hypothetical protein
MARPPIGWRLATVRSLIDETPRAKTILLDVLGWPGHTAGQHVDVRLTAEDGLLPRPNASARVRVGGCLLGPRFNIARTARRELLRHVEDR